MKKKVQRVKKKGGGWKKGRVEKKKVEGWKKKKRLPNFKLYFDLFLLVGKDGESM